MEKPLILIARASTVDQKDSIAAQVKTAKDWAAITGQHVIYDERFYAHESGAKTERESVTLALEWLKTDKSLGGIVVTALDRLGRSTMEVCRVIEALDKQGAVLKVISAGIDTSTAEGKAFIQMLAVMAELERKFIIRRIREGMKLRRATGRRASGGVPYGFYCEPGSDVIIPDPVEMVIYKRLVELKKTLGMLRTAQQLTLEGYKQRNGGDWSRTCVQRFYERYRDSDIVRKAVDSFELPSQAKLRLSAKETKNDIAELKEFHEDIGSGFDVLIH